VVNWAKQIKKALIIQSMCEQYTYNCTAAQLLSASMSPSKNNASSTKLIMILLVWQPIGWMSYKQGTVQIAKERKVIQKCPTTESTS